MANTMGLRARGSDNNVLLSDKWHIGSCTKTMTAVLWARLVDSGSAQWDTPLPEIFGDLNSVDGRWGELTIRDLLNCRAGIPANIDWSRFESARKDMRPLPEQRTDLAAEALGAAPQNPGEYCYSNLSYIIVGAAIDRVSEISFEEALLSRLLGPLGVRSVGFGAPAKICGHGAKMNLGGIGVLKGPPAKPATADSDNPAVFSSAGSMHVSLEDWMTLLSIFVSSTTDRVLERRVDGRDIPRSRAGQRLYGDGMDQGARFSRLVHHARIEHAVVGYFGVGSRPQEMCDGRMQRWA